jgi:membrane protein implicated in regulation of membrane protease activity
MQPLIDLYFAHPFWSWMAFAALLLAIEVATGTGYLLWPAASAAIVALVTRVLPGGFPGQLTLFAGLTLVTSLLGRRFFPRHLTAGGPDINDNLARLVGHHGRVVSDFEDGRGRVFIDGKEWPAVADGKAPKLDQEVKVTAAEGVVLKVHTV